MARPKRLTDAERAALAQTLPAWSPVDGREAIINNEFDKHQDTIGSQWREYNLPLNLPAGTVLNVNMSLGFPHGGNDCPNRCAVETVWFFNHGID